MLWDRTSSYFRAACALALAWAPQEAMQAARNQSYASKSGSTPSKRSDSSPESNQEHQNSRPCQCQCRAFPVTRPASLPVDMCQSSPPTLFALMQLTLLYTCQTIKILKSSSRDLQYRLSFVTGVCRKHNTSTDLRDSSRKAI